MSIPEALLARKLEALRRMGEMLTADFGYTAHVATEIEFYLNNTDGIADEQTLERIIRDACDAQGITLANFERERGHEQFEVALLPSHDLTRMAQDTERFKTLLAETLSPKGIIADFAAKPFAGRPGSGLHVHVHLEDASAKNVFVREDEIYSAPLLHAIGGMLSLMCESMPIFAPAPQAYARFVPKSNVPVTVSWGPNNRTVAVRLPTKPVGNKHVEHRVAGADADAALVMAAILAGVHHGLRHKLKPDDPVFGDASLPMYERPKLPRTYDEAMGRFTGSMALREYFGGDLIW